MLILPAKLFEIVELVKQEGKCKRKYKSRDVEPETSSKKLLQTW
jgi:hypothetical protein